MHALALIAAALAGIGFVAAALLRLRSRRDSEMEPVWLWPVWLGIALLTVALVLAFAEGEHRGFRFGVLVSWVGAASLFFIRRYLTLPSPSLLVLPIGAMALLVALAGLAERVAGEAPGYREEEGGMPLLLLLHIALMTLHLVAMVVAGGSGAVYLRTSRKLKTSAASALRLPSLATLEGLCERSLVVATALLIGGLVTGGAAMQIYRDFKLTSAPALSGMLSMAVLVVMLALRLRGRLGRRYLALGSLVVLGLALLSLGSVFAGHYGR